jgi:hypothetical protein
MSRLARAAVVLGLCALAQGTIAQERVYRCGADGRSYSQKPCAAGRSVDVDDPRSPQQVAQARQAALHDAQLAEALARDRQRRERDSVQRLAAGIGASPVAVDACGVGKHCAKRAADKRHRDKPPKVTLYRAPELPR